MVDSRSKEYHNKMQGMVTEMLSVPDISRPEKEVEEYFYLLIPPVYLFGEEKICDML